MPAPVVTVPVTVPNAPPLIVTVLVPPLLLTVTVTAAAVEVAPVPSNNVAVVRMEPVVPSVTVLPVVLTSNSQGVTSIFLGAMMPGIVENVMSKTHEP